MLEFMIFLSTVLNINVNNTYFSYSGPAKFISSTPTDKKVKKKQKCVIM